MAVTLLDDPRELALVHDGTYFHTVVAAANLDEVKAQFAEKHSPVTDNYFTQVSNGPLITDWRYLGARADNHSSRERPDATDPAHRCLRHAQQFSDDQPAALCPRSV